MSDASDWVILVTTPDLLVVPIGPFASERAAIRHRDNNLDDVSYGSHVEVKKMYNPYRH